MILSPTYRCYFYLLYWIHLIVEQLQCGTVFIFFSIVICCVFSFFLYLHHTVYRNVCNSARLFFLGAACFVREVVLLSMDRPCLLSMSKTVVYPWRLAVDKDL